MSSRAGSQLRRRLEQVCRLPVGYSLDVFEYNRSLALFEVKQKPVLVLLQDFSRTEWSVLKTLLSSTNFYCSYELLSTAMYKDKSMVKPMQSVVHRLKKKLERFSLTIIAIVETGYLLIADPSSRQGALHD